MVYRSKLGYPLDEIVSALQKEIRRGHEQEAAWWALELCHSGEIVRCWRRLCVIAAEDIGPGDPEALRQFGVALAMYREAHYGSGAHIITVYAVLVLARAKKNREANMLTTVLERMRDAGEKLPVPEYALDNHTERGRGRFTSKAEAFAWWVEEGQWCEAVHGPNRYLDAWVDWHGTKVRMTPEQKAAAKAALHRQYAGKRAPVRRQRPR
jgi:hypothetical protein